MGGGIMIYKIETDDKQDFELMFRGADCYFALLDIDNYLREQIKYNSENSEEKIEAFEATREMFFDILHNRNLHTDMVE